MSDENSSWCGETERGRRLILVGGFLGAGKTTLIGGMSRLLMSRGNKCGVITNDQAAGLVDTALMEAIGMESVAEVAGGCFCCRLEELVSVLGKIENEADGGPRVVIAEPVGSCTDLVSTVLLPLERVYRVPFRISPLSVVVDGRRALASLGGRRTPGDFSKDVGYIYRKQLEEAEIVVVNKVDVMGTADVEDLLARLKTEYPEKEVFVISAKTGEGVEMWMDRVIGAESLPERLMGMDYQRYGAGEALLGWLNLEIEVNSGEAGASDGDSWLLELAREVSGLLAEEAIEVAHFKMALRDPEGRLGAVNQTMSGVEPEISKSFGGTFRRGRLTVNLRAEGDPERLTEIVKAGAASSARRAGTEYATREAAAFRPGQPVPTARVTAL